MYHDFYCNSMYLIIDKNKYFIPDVAQQHYSHHHAHLQHTISFSNIPAKSPITYHLLNASAVLPVCPHPLHLFHAQGIFLHQNPPRHHHFQSPQISYGCHSPPHSHLLNASAVLPVCPHPLHLLNAQAIFLHQNPPRHHHFPSPQISCGCHSPPHSRSPHSHLLNASAVLPVCPHPLHLFHACALFLFLHQNPPHHHHFRSPRKSCRCHSCSPHSCSPHSCSPHSRSPHSPHSRSPHYHLTLKLHLHQT